MDTNPETIQAPQAKHPPSALPLILLHDGGGTTFAYHCLPPLPRAIYAIHNPRFESGGKWEGGICEMARVYAPMIRALVSSPGFPRRRDGRVEILLGGWSLGGYLSLELASLLGGMVRGVILVDSPFPSGGRRPVHESLPALPPTATRSQRLARECISHAGGNLTGWEVPETNAPAVLIRATGYVPVDGPGKSPIDVKREEDDLGWEGRGGVQSVLEVEGHHFDIFDFKRVERTGGVIERACRVLEGR